MKHTKKQLHTKLEAITQTIKQAYKQSEQPELVGLHSLLAIALQDLAYLRREI
jgi:hypothetical protein